MNKQIQEKSRYNIIYEAFQSCADEELVVKLFNDWLAESGRMFVPLTKMDKWEEACEKYDIRGKHIDCFSRYSDYFYGMDDWVVSEECLGGIFEYTLPGGDCVKYYSKLPDSQFIEVLESLKYRDIDKIKEQLAKADERYTEIKDILCEEGDLGLFVKWYNNYLSSSHSKEIPLTEFTQENWEKAIDTYNITAKQIKRFCDWHSYFYSIDGYNTYTVDGDYTPWDLSYQEFADCAKWYAETEQNYNECLELLGDKNRNQKPEPAKLLKYCFCSKEHGNCTKEEIASLVETTDKPFVYTYGLAYRNPTTHRKPMSKAEAISIVKTKGMIDITEEDEVIHIEEFSENDMW